MELSEISVSENKLGEETVIKKSKDAENKVKEHPYVNSSFVADIDTYVQGRCENHVYEHLQRADDSAASCKRGCIARFKQYKGFMMLSLIGLVFIVAVTALAISIIGLREKTVMGERGIWNDWEPWGDCSATCSYGMERRERKCSASSGKQCYGDSSEYRICNKMLCPGTRAIAECGHVAFRATLTKSLGTVPLGQTIIYDKVELNIGNAYHPFHGVFTAPCNGTYLFSMKIGNINKSGVIHLKVNDVTVEYAWAGFNANWDMGGVATVVYLVAGDDVWVEGRGIVEGVSGSDGVGEYKHVGFAGTLLHSF